jgi:hypothetical protein
MRSVQRFERFELLERLEPVQSSTRRAGHVFDDDRRFSGYIFAQEGHQRSHLQVAGAAGLAATDNPDGLILVVGLLSESETRKKARR